MGEGQSEQEDGELVLVVLEGEVANLDKLVTLARECGFRKLLSALVKDLHRAQAEVVEIIAMAAADEPRATAAEGAEAAARPDEIPLQPRSSAMAGAAAQAGPRRGQIRHALTTVAVLGSGIERPIPETPIS